MDQNGSDKIIIMNIGIIGLGYVGLTLAAVASARGFTVYAVEVNNDIKNSLSKSEAHFYEPGLNSILHSSINKKLFIVSNFAKQHNIDIYIVTVGTPLIDNTKIVDYHYIYSALATIKETYTGRELVMLRSTVSVGSTRSIVIPYLAEMSGLKQEGLLVAFCPERTIEGMAVKELQELPQIIGANCKAALEFAERFFRELTATIVRVDSLEAAELVKLFNNTYRDIHFAIGNLFNDIAQSFELNGEKLISAANFGYSRSNIALPGFVGGPCLEKDAYILTNNIRESHGKSFILNARLYNESLEDDIVKWVINTVTCLSLPRRICISGLAFKGVPGTSDLRGSTSINICKKLKSNSFELSLHDFYAKSSEVEQLNLGCFTKDMLEACKSHSIILIMTNSSEYVKIELQSILESLDSNPFVFDAWSNYKFPANDLLGCMKYFTLGNFKTHQFS